MARSIWSGAISFGLVNVPVKLYSAVSRKSVRFHQLHDATGARIQQKRIDPQTGEEVLYEHIVKGYEIGPDRYVVITPQELESLDPEKTRTIEILDFVDLEEIDPIYYDHPYYLAPGPGATKAYILLREAMKRTGKVAIARSVIRTKESLAAVRVAGDVLTMSTMLFPDEVVSPDAIEELAEVRKQEAKVGKRELEMAEQLIGSLTAKFDPNRYRDEYRERLLEMIERKAEGEEIAIQPPTEKSAKAPDLMAALEASIQAAKAHTGDAPKPARRRTAAKPSSKSSGKDSGAKRGGSPRSKAKSKS